MIGVQEAPQLLVLAGVLVFLLVSACWHFYFPLAMDEFGAEAEQRAADLLREVLSEDERRQLSDQGYLAVPSPRIVGRVYRVPADPGWVEVHQEGTLAMRVCVQPIHPLPYSDVVLMHKLMIEGNEEEYLRKANIVQARRPPQPRWRHI